jgi:hypothetical protein
MTNDRSLSMAVLARLMSCLLVALGMLWSAGTTPANAATFTYDVSTAERADVQEIRVAGAGPVHGSEAREGSGSPSVEGRGAATTPAARNHATNTGGGGAEPPPDNSDMYIDDVLDAASAFLGAGYSEVPPGSGRFVSADGIRVVRMKESDITGRHGRGSHANFETLECDPKIPGGKAVTRSRLRGRVLRFGTAR